MNKQVRRKAFRAEVETQLKVRVNSVNIMKFSENLYQIRCFNVRGQYIGGASGLSKSDAETMAREFIDA